MPVLQFHYFVAPELTMAQMGDEMRMGRMGHGSELMTC